MAGEDGRDITARGNAKPHYGRSPHYDTLWGTDNIHVSAVAPATRH